jgi:hypothetical protein
MGKNRTKRDRLFSLYASNLSMYCPHITDQFLCPICLRLFDRDALICESPEITLAHIVPHSMGGHLCTLTCRKCNNDIGFDYDSQIKNEKNLYDWEKGIDKVCASLNYDGGNVPVYLWHTTKDNYFSENSNIKLDWVNSREPSYQKFIRDLRTSENNAIQVSITTKRLYDRKN